MGTSADEIRKDIERTRHDLGETIHEVTDRTNPHHIAERGKQRMRRRVRGTRDKVMGSAEHGMHQAEGQIKGNPLAAGLIALGGGALAASLLPADRVSKQAAQTLSREAGPVAEQAKREAQHVGQQVGENVKHSAKDAAHHVEERAKQSAEQVKQDAGSSAGQVRDQAQHAARDVEHEARRQQM